MKTKNEQALLEAHFLPSIFVRWYVLSPSFVANLWRQVYLCASRALADHCAIRLILLPTFSQMCPCSLLAGAHVTLGGTHQSAHNIDMQCLTHPFRNSSGSIFSMRMHPFFSITLCYLSYLFFNWYPHPSSLICICCCCCHQHILIPGTLCSDASFLWLTVSPWSSSLSPCWSALHLSLHHTLCR